MTLQYAGGTPVEVTADETTVHVLVAPPLTGSTRFRMRMTLPGEGVTFDKEFVVRAAPRKGPKTIKACRVVQGPPSPTTAEPVSTPTRDDGRCNVLVKGGQTYLDVPLHGQCLMFVRGVQRIAI